MSNLLQKASIITTPTAYSEGKLHSVKPVQSFGSELVANGTFDTDSDWTKGTGTTISDGNANFVNATTVSLYQNIGTQSKTVKVEFTVTNYTSGTLNVYSGGNQSVGVVNISANALGLYTANVIRTGGNVNIIFGSSDGFTGSIDNVSVKEVIDADLDFTRGSSATRINSQGLIEDVQVLSGNLVQNGDFSQIGSELIVNGDFDTDSDWTKYYAGDNNSITIANGVLSFDSNTNQNVQQTISSSNLSGFYKITYTITSYTRGNAHFLLGGGSNIYLGFETGTFTKYVQGGGNSNNFVIYGGIFGQGGELSIDNVSVKEVGQNWEFGGTASISNSKATINSPSGELAEIYQSSVLTIGKKYKLQCILNKTSGDTQFVNGGTFVLDNGSNVIEFIATDTRVYFKRGSGSVISSIDNISVQEITEDTNIPRIDYSNGEGSILLEGESTNLITYSEDFSQSSWAKPSITIESGYLSPTGEMNASKSIATSTDPYFSFAVNGVTNLTYSASIYIKGTTSTIGEIARLWIIRDNVTYHFEDFTITNNWQRISTTKTFTSTPSSFVSIRVDLPNTNVSVGDETYVWGAQLEEQSFASSYIPSLNGTPTTRLSESLSGAGSSDLINSTEGVLYCEAATLVDPTGIMIIGLSDGTTANRISITFHSTLNRIQVYSQKNSSQLFNLDTTSASKTNFNKIAISYSSTSAKFFLNGTLVDSATPSDMFAANTLDRVNYNNGYSGLFEGKVKTVAVFKEALTDSELECLTKI